MESPYRLNLHSDISANAMTHNRNLSKVEVEEAFKKMKTFSNDEIDAADVDLLLKTLAYTCTEEQMNAYLKLLTLMKIHVTTLDRDKDGFIDESEFKCIVAMLLIHDPSFPTVNYKTFVEEADTNKDGKVSIDEAVEWFSKNANN
ncbi:putative calcium-binding protein CML20 [Folsomia candida]|uniref:Putative calcium-binding protein CML20 n=1 Tax=Folsomia candida TaxID=158441 RepID=A0A226EX62_FOLCA|nr:putative calcium-binding protein CML20 [Folsomia candida]